MHEILETTLMVPLKYAGKEMPHLQEKLIKHLGHLSLSKIFQAVVECHGLWICMESLLEVLGNKVCI